MKEKKPKPDSKEWWRKVAQGLSVQLHDAEITIHAREATIHMAVARLGGIVEGNPTGAHNFLQRIDALVALESAPPPPRGEKNK